MSAPESSKPIDRTGLTQGVGAYLLWGLLPLYFALLPGVGAGEIVAHRIVWSLGFLAVLVLAIGHRAQLVAAFRNPRAVAMLSLSAALISINWIVYIWAVQNHHVLAGSLGYFLNPLVNVLLGVAVLGERLNRVQMAAVLLAGAGVGVLALGAGGGLWISLTLAVTFAFYGLVRKLAPVEAVEGLAIETALLTPVALLYLVLLGGGVFEHGALITALLVGSGVLTATPLLLFAAAARRLKLSTVGLLQYIAPTMQFLLAVFVFGEALSAAHLICFGLIWAGLALYAGDGALAARRYRTLTQPRCAP